MEVNIYKIHPALRDIVCNISTVNAVLPPHLPQVVTPYPPTAFQSLMFYCNHPIKMGKVEEKIFLKQPRSLIIGPQYSRVNVVVEEALQAIRVDFLPGGLYRLLGIPMHELFDLGVDATAILGGMVNDLNERLRNISKLEEGKNMVENFLLERAKRCREILPIDFALLNLMQSQGIMPMDKMAEMACLSLKQFERKCKERIGMNPKTYSRILKFSKAYRMHEVNPAMSWTKIAHASGYYDQMHMIRDFKLFAGTNPTHIEKQLLRTPLRMQKDLLL